MVATMVGGAIVGAGFVGAVRTWAPHRELAIYAFGLVVAAANYLLFALVGGDPVWALVEAVGLVFFGVFAAVGLRGVPIVLAAGWGLHVGWDGALHGSPMSFVPAGYPALCVGFDLVLAGWIALARPRRSPGR